jgi:hypothetical protein
MRYDPQARLEKYRSIVVALRRAGFVANVETEKCAVDCAVVQHIDFAGCEVVVYRRERGWFVGMPQPNAKFKVPREDAIMPLLGRLREVRTLFSCQFPPSVVTAYGLKAVDRQEWSSDERREEFARWARFGWDELTRTEIDSISEAFEMTFFPDGDLVLPEPSRSWSLTKISRLSGEEGERAETAISMHVLSSLQSCISPGQQILALDWPHPCFRLDVHRGIQRVCRDEWAMPLVPRSGDSYLFLATDFTMGIFALGDLNLHVFGQPLIQAFLTDFPADLLG